MSFTDHKITQFTHRIVDLPDQPNLPADELKARFDSSPEELRQAVNGICDDATTLSGKVDSILAETFDGVVEKSMLSEALADELDAKAVETSVASRFTAEQTAREAADSALDTRVDALETELPQKVEIYIGTYNGTGTGNQIFTLPITPKAVLIMPNGGGQARMVTQSNRCREPNGNYSARLDNGNQLTVYDQLNSSTNYPHSYIAFV